MNTLLLLAIWIGLPTLIVTGILLHLRSKASGFRIIHQFHHDTLFGAECTCGYSVQVETPRYLLSYEDKQEAEEQVQSWIAEHIRSHATSG